MGQHVMAKAMEGVGSDRAELKKLLKLSADKPVHMAFALGADGKAVIQLDKLKPARTLEKSLKEGLDGGKNYRFGTVSIDPEDPQVVQFVVNKTVGGCGRKLVVALKGTGFKKIRIVTEDGEAVEEAEDEEGEPEDGAATQRVPADRDEDATLRAEPAPPATPTKWGRPDPETLTQQLTEMVKQMLGVIKHNPSQKTALAGLATDAQVSLKRGDLDQAAAGIEILRLAIATQTQTQTPTAPASLSPSADGTGPAPDPAALQKIQKSRVAWTATRAKVDGELQRLTKAILGAGTGEDLSGFEDEFQSVVTPLLDELDDTLADTLDRAGQAAGAEYAQLLDEARRTVERYTALVQASPVISGLDRNPFVPLAIGKTLTGTLSALAVIIR